MKQMKPYTMVKADGTKEVIYLSDESAGMPLSSKIQIAYTTVGIIVLLLTGTIAYYQLKKIKSNG